MNGTDRMDRGAAMTLALEWARLGVPGFPIKVTWDDAKKKTEKVPLTEHGFVLDLSEVEFMDSSCLRVLQQARGTLTADGGSLVLRNPSDAARRILTAAQADYLLRTEADAEPPAGSS